MRPFVVRLDPTPFDRAAASSAPGEEDLASLKQTWNAWNGKVHGLLDKGSRIENLFWRRWHMEQRQGPVQHASTPVPQANFPHDLSASVEAVERRRATEDLESFLRVTLQAAQPGGQAQLVHNPPTYDAFAIPSTSQPPPPPQQPVQSSFQPPVIHAPQPQRLAFNPSPEWGYSALPSVSQPPPSAAAAVAHQNRIIATPSWTALISDPAASGTNGIAQPQPQQVQPSPAAMPPPPPQQPTVNALGFPPFFPPNQALPTDPFSAAAAAAGFTFGSGMPSIPNPLPPAIPSPSFTLPPTATLFSDLPSALSSAPSAGAPPAFFSSYGMYRPVVAPYPRFLTPSPEPSVLGELELELGPATGEFAAGSVGAAAALPPVEPDGMDSVWKDLESRADGGVGSSSGGVNGLGGEGGEAKTDPFEGMSLAQMRSRANSLEAVDREAARFQAYGVGTSGLSMVDQAAREVAEAAAAAAGEVGGSDADKGKSAAAKGKRKAGDAGGGGKKTKAGAPSPPLTSDGVDPSAALNGAAGAAAAAAAAAAVQNKVLAGGKKNRNPHSTQLPGNGQRRQPKEEAGEGHDGPICSHCASITTPLWRRGPDDELLCNACGLYLKLHGKSRPKTFGKNNGSKRSSNGAAAQAAASGVPPSCNNCGATSTPMWRKDQEGRLCCNACSLYYKLHKVPRPASLAQKRKAAAAAKANLAAAASSNNPAVKADLGGSPPTDIPPTQLPTPVASSSETSPAGVPAADSTAGVAAPPLPPPHQAHLVPPNPYQLPPTMPGLPPGAPGALPGLMHPHQALPPGWPPLPQGYPFPPISGAPNGALPPGYPHQIPHHQLPQLHHPQPQLAHLQQQQQQQQKFSLPPAIPGPLPPSPFAQTAWGALAYGIVSAAAAEEAGGGPGGMGGAQPPPPQ